MRATRPFHSSLLTLALIALATTPSDTQAQRPVVVIDAGHGGPDVVVEHEGWLEKDLVLRIAFVIGSEFVDAGYDVVYTRTRDVPVGWDGRQRIAEEAEAQLLFMLHANGNEDTSRNGAEVYANLEDSRHERLANLVGEELGRLGAAVVEHRPWPFLASGTVPTAMIELAFMTNADDRRKLRSTDFHHELGRALVAAGAAASSGGS